MIVINGRARVKATEARALMVRPPIPRALKRFLVPAWNEAHRVGWLLRDYSAACLRLRWCTCVVCGRFRPMLDRRRVVPPRLAELWGLSPRLAAALARKESGDCAGCGAKRRARRMARVLLQLHPAGSARSLADWVRDPSVQQLRIAEINRIEGIHDQFLALPHFAASDYLPGSAPGAIVEGTRSEDLTRLTYPGQSFDLVLTSESLEHVPDLSRAIREIKRVLVPGGRHVCTVPLLPGVPRTFARAVLHEDGRLEHLARPICHPGGDVGYPVFTEFGADFGAIVAAEGFEVATFFGPPSEDDLGQVYVWRKPE